MRGDASEDAKKFGSDAWVYCASHLAAHSTGWCTVPIDQKIKLKAKSSEAAVAECKRRGLKLYADN